MVSLSQHEIVVQRNQFQLNLFFNIIILDFASFSVSLNQGRLKSCGGPRLMSSYCIKELYFKINYDNLRSQNVFLKSILHRKVHFSAFRGPSKLGSFRLQPTQPMRFKTALISIVLYHCLTLLQGANDDLNIASSKNKNIQSRNLKQVFFLIPACFCCVFFGLTLNA